MTCYVSSSMAATPRAPIFVTLDAMIAYGYGDVPRIEIPENWRDIPREVNQQDRARARAEQFTPEKERIAAIEELNSRASFVLAEQVMQNESERRKLRRGRRVGSPNRPWPQRVAWREAAMRARRNA